jgi:hypothetical protein
MDEQEFLHRLSGKTNVNIELLKELTGKVHAAIMLFWDIQPRVGLREAKRVVDAFAAEYK